MRFFISITYNGEHYSGWQKQPNATSVQETLENALSIVLGCRTAVTGAGRTDTGVSATDYTAHFDTETDIAEAGALVCKMNAILPHDIAVNFIARVAPEAHARFDATSRTYRYKLHTAKDPFAYHSYYCKFPLDIDKMNEAAALLLGTRDFSSFEKVGSDNTNSVCTLTKARWTALDSSHLEFEISANRFLRNMVRAIVGTLIDVGRGRTAVEEIPSILEAGDRCAAGQSVPGEPLLLCRIEYPYELLPISSFSR